MFDLVAIGIVWVAHDPCGASVAHDLALFDNVVDPEANVVDANEILARTLRRRVGLELQKGKIHDAICQEQPSASAPSSSVTSSSPSASL